MEVTLDYRGEDVLARYVNTGDVAIDIGANEGVWTKFLASRFKTVHAIEPQEYCRDKINSLGCPNVTFHCTAAWTNIGRLMFRQNLTNFGEQQGAIMGTDAFIVSAGEADHFEVPCQPVDTLGIQGKIDFMKVDVDGSEIHALIGCQEILKHHHPLLIIECHTDENRAFIMTWLPKFGYKVEILPEIRIRDETRYRDEIVYIHAEV